MKIDLKVLSLFFILALSINANSLVSFHREQATQLFKNLKPSVMLLLGNLDQNSQPFKVVNEVAKSFPDFMFTYSKTGDEPYLKLLELLGVTKKTTPIVLFFNSYGDKFYYDPDHYGDVTVKQLNNFLNKAQGGQIGIYLRSGFSHEDISEEERLKNEQYMTYFNAYTLQQLRNNSPKDLVIVAYASWCTYSEKFAPTFRQIARRMQNNPNVIFGKLEATENEIRGYEPAGYPSILFFGKEKHARPVVYYGDRSAVDVIYWIKRNSEYQWFDPLPETQEEKAATQKQKVNQQL